MVKRGLIVALAVLMVASLGLISAMYIPDENYSSNYTSNTTYYDYNGTFDNYTNYTDGTENNSMTNCESADSMGIVCNDDEILIVTGRDESNCPIYDCEESLNEDDGVVRDNREDFICCKSPRPSEDTNRRYVREYVWVPKRVGCSEEVEESYCDEGRARIEGHRKIVRNEGLRAMQQRKNMRELRAGRYLAMCSEGCNVTLNETENGTFYIAKFSNGKNAFVKVMPDVAAERALERLRLKNCLEEEGCTIELKEVASKRKEEMSDSFSGAVYEIKRERSAKLFGILKRRMVVRAEVDAETGEVVKVKKAWWAFLASEPLEE
ncbi:hypothetical protein B6U91_01655 [Candidatus Pacearchaeota archaeon ex4484_71]|nr:MAG: hypothetical protein B6U91_01655 [Candidatus Pacearchaeota archaeon ex4484_71]